MAMSVHQVSFTKNLKFKHVIFGIVSIRLTCIVFSNDCVPLLS